jgi:thiamine pyrophosphokinase
MKTVVVAHGALEPRDLNELDDAELVIAADGGANALAERGFSPHAVVGDLDSIEASLAERLGADGARIERHPTDKDASDAELALERASAAGADEIVILGALGGPRLDHEVANLLLLADAAWAGRSVRLVRGSSTTRVVRGGESLELIGGVGDVVSLLPIGGDAAGVRTAGLRWPLHGERLRLGRSRGLSNEVVAPPASVSLDDGMLLVVEIRAQGDERA